MDTREWLSVTMGRLGDGLRKARVSAWVDAANAHVELRGSVRNDEDALRRRLDTMSGDTSERRMARELIMQRVTVALQCQTQELDCLARAMDAAVEGLGIAIMPSARTETDRDVFFRYRQWEKGVMAKTGKAPADPACPIPKE